MPKRHRLASSTANASCNAVTQLLNGGYLRLYSGTQPTTPDSPPSGTLLAELRFQATAFQDAVGGVANANAITEEGDAKATGYATWYRVLGSGGQAVFDGSVGTSDSDMVLASNHIVQHAIVEIRSFTYKVNTGA